MLTWPGSFKGATSQRLSGSLWYLDINLAKSHTAGKRNGKILESPPSFLTLRILLDLCIAKLAATYRSCFQAGLTFVLYLRHPVPMKTTKIQKSHRAMACQQRSGAVGRIRSPMIFL